MRFMVDSMDEIIEEILTQSYSKIIEYEEVILKKLSDITLKELRTLELISKGEKTGGNTATKIASVLGISLGTLTSNIDRLIKKGLVEKDKLIEDKRTTVIYLTPTGKKTLREYKNEHLKIVRKALENLSDKEKVTIVNIVNKFDM